MINYSFLQKKLHNICLGNLNIKKSLFEIEKKFFFKKINFKENKHVFISGLPRSGTTILLNFLYSTGNYASLTYSDMPFILSPNLYSIFSKKKKFKEQFRMHNDGIKINLDSPESFDEIFFNTFYNEEIEKKYLDYIALILIKYKKYTYLSKNNNNYKRFEFIKNLLPKSIFIVPFREPIQHSYSLLKQHLNFENIHKKDSFISKYMNYLGHNEFGAIHHYWFKPRLYFEINNINYWLEQWLLFYKNLLFKNETINNIRFICYEKICSDVKNREKLTKELNVQNNNNFEFKKALDVIKVDFDEKLGEECNKVYKDLFDRSIK